MDVSMFGAMTVPVIVGICAITGWLVKRFTPEDDRFHDFIPTFVCIEGVILAIMDTVITGTPFGISTIFAGMASGVASTGFHQMITRWVKDIEGDHAA